MANYQVAIIRWPEKWEPECADDVPLELNGPVEMLFESDDLFVALDRTIKHNESPEAKGRRRWAVVVEPGSMGRIWPFARVCTPVIYKLTSIWWPDGWEPNSPLDVPNCVWKSQEPLGGEWLAYPEAEATMLALNRQCMDHPGATWHVVVAIENEAVSRTVSHDPSGVETTVEVRRMHVVRPSAGGHGECSRCPAHEFSCAKTDWSSQMQAVSASRSRAFGATGM
jgi:hypothetical protein